MKTKSIILLLLLLLCISLNARQLRSAVGQPLHIYITFIETITEEQVNEFMEMYKKFNFTKFGTPTGVNNCKRHFIYRDSMWQNPDLLQKIMRENIVFDAWFSESQELNKWVPRKVAYKYNDFGAKTHIRGQLVLVFHEGVTKEQVEALILKYEHFDLECFGIDLWYSKHGRTFAFDFDIIDEERLMKILNAEKIVKSATWEPGIFIPESKSNRFIPDSQYYNLYQWQFKDYHAGSIKIERAWDILNENQGNNRTKVIGVIDKQFYNVADEYSTRFINSGKTAPSITYQYYLGHIINQI